MAGGPVPIEIGGGVGPAGGRPAGCAAAATHRQEATAGKAKLAGVVAVGSAIAVSGVSSAQ